MNGNNPSPIYIYHYGGQLAACFATESTTSKKIAMQKRLKSRTKTSVLHAALTGFQIRVFLDSFETCTLFMKVGCKCLNDRLFGTQKLPSCKSEYRFSPDLVKTSSGAF